MVWKFTSSPAWSATTYSAGRATLQRGMVFSDEPGIRIKGEFGIRPDDHLHVTAGGAEAGRDASQTDRPSNRPLERPASVMDFI